MDGIRILPSARVPGCPCQLPIPESGTFFSSPKPESVLVNQNHSLSPNISHGGIGGGFLH